MSSFCAYLEKTDRVWVLSLQTINIEEGLWLTPLWCKGSDIVVHWPIERYQDCSMSSATVKIFEKLLYVFTLIYSCNRPLLDIFHFKHNHLSSALHPEKNVTSVVAGGATDACVIWESFLKTLYQPFFPKFTCDEPSFHTLLKNRYRLNCQNIRCLI